MHHELLDVYAVTWLFAGVGLVTSVAFLTTAWRLKARGKKMPAYWDAFYAGFGIALALAILTCFVIAHHGGGLPHF